MPNFFSHWQGRYAPEEFSRIDTITEDGSSCHQGCCPRQTQNQQIRFDFQFGIPVFRFYFCFVEVLLKFSEINTIITGGCIWVFNMGNLDLYVFADAGYRRVYSQRVGPVRQLERKKRLIPDDGLPIEQITVFIESKVAKNGLLVNPKFVNIPAFLIIGDFP